MHTEQSRRKYKQKNKNLKSKKTTPTVATKFENIPIEF